MGGGVRLIDRKSGIQTYQDIFPQYPVDSTVILSNVVTSKDGISLKEVVDAQLVGDNRKRLFIIPFFSFQKGYNLFLKVLQPLVPHHARRSQWTTRFGLVLN